jgi:CheY-like chemotaxis protein
MIDLYSLSMRVPTLLVAGKADLLRRNLHARLVSEGYEVHLASSGPEAVAYVNREHPDGILADATLPGLTGVDVLRLCRGNEDFKDVVGVLMCMPEEFETTRVRHGSIANLVVEKPILLDSLIDYLLEHLAPPPRPGQVLTIASPAGDRFVLAGSWSPRSERGLAMEPGPEFDWLGADLVAGAPVTLSYPGPRGIRLIRSGALRVVTKRNRKRVAEIYLKPELPRRQAAPTGGPPILGVKYASPEGDYRPAIAYNLSVSGMRIGGVTDEVEPGSELHLFFFQQERLVLAVRGTAKACTPDGMAHYEVSLAFDTLPEATQQQLNALIKPGCLAPGAL